MDAQYINIYTYHIVKSCVFIFISISLAVTFTHLHRISFVNIRVLFLIYFIFFFLKSNGAKTWITEEALTHFDP